MYAVIKTGGKQYRVKAGDLLVVDKLDGEPGAKVAFDQVLLIGEGKAVTVGSPTVAGASVSATLIETRKGEKIKIFKKIRRQGYRRTRGHRQLESVLRVTALAANGSTETWDGTVDLTPKALRDLRARNLARAFEAAATAKVEAPKPKAAAKPAPRAEAAPAAEAAPEAAAPAPEAKAAPKKAAAPKAKAAPKVKAEAKAEAAPKKAASPAKKASATAKPAAVKAAAPAKKPAAKKAPAKKSD